MASRKDIEIPYAIRAGAIVHVSEVARGLDCGCICARCGDALIARKGNFRQHHFAHYRDLDCLGAAESLLHRLAKELLSNAKSLALPAYIYRANTKPRFDTPAVSIERVIIPASRVSINSVTVEQRLGHIVPDLLLRLDEGDLILEIAVSHQVDRAKLRHVRRINVPILELILKPEDVLLSRSELFDRLVEDTSIKSWLFHPAQRSAEADWVKTRRNLWRRSRTGNSRAYFQTAKFQARMPVDSSWREYNDWAERFSRKHGRYPTLEETRAFEKMRRR